MVKFVGWYRLNNPMIPVRISLWCSACGEHQDFHLSRPDQHRQIHVYVSTCGRVVQLTSEFVRDQGEQEEMRGW